MKSQEDEKADDNCCDWQFKGISFIKKPFYPDMSHVLQYDDVF